MDSYRGHCPVLGPNAAVPEQTTVLHEKVVKSGGREAADSVGLPGNNKTYFVILITEVFSDEL